MSLNENSNLSIRDQWARQHAIRGVKQEWNKMVLRPPPKQNEPRPPLLDVDDPTLPPAPLPKTPMFKYPPEKPIVIHLGIVGAGIAGLFAARVLDHLNWQLFLMAIKNSGFTGIRPDNIDEFYRIYDPIKKSQKMLLFTYDVLESAGQDRVGGRLFTYDFGGPRNSHDYYDVGAMRFPDNPVMAR